MVLFTVKKEYRALAAVLEKHPRFIFYLTKYTNTSIIESKPFSFAAIENMYDRTITVNGLAKAFAMTGWRIGYLLALQNGLQKHVQKCKDKLLQEQTVLLNEQQLQPLLAPVQKFNTW